MKLNNIDYLIKKSFTIEDVLFFFLLLATFLFPHQVYSQIVMVLFCGWIVVLILRKHKFILAGYNVIGGIFIVYCFIAAKLTPSLSHEQSMIMIKSLTLTWIVHFCVINYVAFKGNILSVLEIYDLGVFLFSVVVFLASIGSITAGRLGSLSGYNSNKLALLVSTSLVIRIYLLYIKKKKTVNILAVLWYLFTILLSGSRKGLIMAVAGLAMSVFVFHPKKLINKVIVFVIITAVTLTLVFAVPFLYELIGKRIESLFYFALTNSHISSGGTDYSLRTRSRLIEMGVRYIKEKPVLGWGIDTFKVMSLSQGFKDVGQFGPYAHNNYIELLFGVGILGTLIYYINHLLLIGSLFAKKKHRTNETTKVMFIILLLLLLVEYGYVSYYERSTLFIWAIVAGFLANKSITFKIPAFLSKVMTND